MAEKKKKVTTSNAVKDSDKLDDSYIADVNAKCYILENSLRVS